MIELSYASGIRIVIVAPLILSLFTPIRAGFYGVHVGVHGNETRTTQAALFTFFYFILAWPRSNLGMNI